MRSDRFDQLAPALTDAAERGGKAHLHVFARECEQFNLLLLDQFLLAERINEAFVCQENTLESFNQVIQQADVMGAGWQEGIANIHAGA